MDFTILISPSTFHHPYFTIRSVYPHFIITSSSAFLSSPTFFPHSSSVHPESILISSSAPILSPSTPIHSPSTFHPRSGLWAPDVGHDSAALATIKRGGYYATNPTPKLTVVSLNVNFWVDQNPAAKTDAGAKAEACVHECMSVCVHV